MSFNPPLIWFLIGLGLVLLGLTDSLAWQIIVFSVSSVALLLMLRHRLKGQFLGHTGSEQDLDHDLEEFVGRVVSVTQPIRPDQDGRIEFKGAGWEARSDQSFEPGDRVVITGLDGIRVTVAAVSSSSTADQEALS